jgi:amino acid adenylation domain-containing protein
MMARTLYELLERASETFANRTAVEDADRDKTVSYGELNAFSDGIRESLLAHDVRLGDRVGICAPKSIGAVAAIFGVLKAGAAYVPVDASAPPSRNASIFADCSVRAIIAARECVGTLAAALDLSASVPLAEFKALQAFDCDLVLIGGLARPSDVAQAAPAQTLAYILYTSGSTGKPKGVVHTHASALSFVDWCCGLFAPTMEDCFSSHAPFHFDLSILDLYLPLKHGARVVLLNEELGKTPSRLAAAIAERGISAWYSTPSVLRLLVEYGSLERYDWSRLRLVLFAGEIFPIKYLRALKEAWPGPRYFNLYGPTETNVCTYFEVPHQIPAERQEAFPIGLTCENDRTRVVDEQGRDIRRGEEGELVVAGGSVMVGYWHLPQRTAEAFLVDDEGARWYRTGDLVRQQADASFIFLGRRDRMVKRRGYRVELGEIEAALYQHPAILEAAAIALPDGAGGVSIKAVLSVSGAAAPSLVELKAHCSRTLPLYMVPDRFSFVDSLPKTSTDKVDYQRLKALG